jgi:3-phosphoshikimate 1-carboxyvinyltransferase
LDSASEQPIAVPVASDGVHGSIRVPPSKSLTQRALVAAALAGSGSRVQGPLDAEDPRLLFAALRAAGYRLRWKGDSIVADGRDEVPHATLWLGNNGTGARFLVALLAALPGEWAIDGSPRLRERPVAPLVAALRRLGAEIRPLEAPTGEVEPHLPLGVRGRSLRGGEVNLDPSASSQFVSALLLLGASLPQGITIRLTAPTPSRPYLDLTAEVLAAFGVNVESEAGGSTLSVGGGGFRPTAFAVEGDWSAAAFPLAAAAAVGGSVEVVGVRRSSRQGDAVVLTVLERAGCRVVDSGRGVVVTGPVSRPLAADLRHAPDLFPALAVVVGVHGGRLEGLGGLAAKESDRLVVMASRLASLGFVGERDVSSFTAPGGRPRTVAPSEPLDPADDHRIAMALAVAGCVIPGVRVARPGCVAKSWPGFWSDWQALQGAGP